MNELIKIDNKGLVSARGLHEFLENKRQFADWIKQRIDQYGFIKNEDFTVHKFVNGKATQIDYVITTEMAKELSMVENNAKGKEARRYFIAAEKKLKESIPQLSKELQSIIMLDQRTIETNARIDHLENDMPLFNIECKELQALVRKVGIQALNGKGQAYKDNSLRGRVYSDIQQQLRREFQVNRYEAIKRSQLEKARSMVESYKLPGALWDEIIIANQQIPFSEFE